MRIGYYTGWLRPEMEGTSREVFALARHFNGRFILGLSKNETFRVLWGDRAIGLHPGAYAGVKALFPLFELTQQLAHIYDSLSCWHYLRNLKRCPIILTAVTGSEPLARQYYDRVSFVVADSDARFEELLALDFPEEKVKVIYPGIDLKLYSASELLEPEPFKVLFASAPPTIPELKDRGVWQILEAAQQLPAVQFILAWRPWGNSLPAVRQRIEELNVPNVHLLTERIADMRVLYHQVHCVLAPFHRDGGKSCPTSVVEACACGKPVIVGPGVGIRKLIMTENAGLGIGGGTDELVDALQTVKRSRVRMATNARALAERVFDLHRFLSEYAALYRSTLDSCGNRSRAH